MPYRGKTALFFSLAPQAQRRPTATPGSLTQRLAELLQHSLAPSTRGTYKIGLRRLTKFCSRYNVTPLPATKQTVTYFAVSLSKNLAPSTIHSGIHREMGLNDPTDGNHQLTLVLKGVRRQHLPSTPWPRKPITPPLLSKMVQYIAHSKSLPRRDRQMLAAAFTLAFCRPNETTMTLTNT